MEHKLRVLVPTDFSDHANAAVRYAAPFAARLGAEVVLVHATALRPPFDALPGSGDAFIMTYEENDLLARVALEETRAAHLGGVDAHTRLAFGKPANAILEAAHASGADLIVMGTRGRGGLARAILGSVAEAVIGRSHVPVLTVRRDSANDASRMTRILCPIDGSEAAAKAYRHALWLASAFDAELIALDATATATDVHECARTHDVDLIVAGATTGSAFDGLTRHAPCPVLTVPAGATLIEKVAA